MENAAVIIGTLSWLCLGFSAFVYMWTKEFDFTTEDLMLAFLFALLGIISWPLCWFLFLSDKFNPKIIVKRK
ncbi:MAG: hypothetical protein ACTSQ8_22460 [Candidatus Helarchaeota archaeon]